MILYIKHIDIEGPGTLGEYFERQGYASRTIDLAKGESLPDSFNDMDAVVCLGGPMNVDEEERYPYLREENAFIQSILELKIPFMGLCLGSQLLAKAAGAKVIKSPFKEIGFFDIRFNAKGIRDPLFKGLESLLEVFQWHEDMVEVPEGSVLLAGSEACPHQAFKVGNNAYGLQFHVEITELSIRQWCDKYVKEHNTCTSMKESMLNDYSKKREAFEQAAQIMYSNFEQIIRKVSG